MKPKPMDSGLDAENGNENDETTIGDHQDEEYTVLAEDTEYDDQSNHPEQRMGLLAEDEVEIVTENQSAEAELQTVVEEHEVYADSSNEEYVLGSVEDMNDDFVTEGYVEDDERNQQLVIFKTDGGDNAVITYSIPITSADEYEADDTDRQYDAVNYFRTHHHYQIIDGYLVPTPTPQHQSLNEPQRDPIPISPPLPPPPDPEPKVLSNPLQLSDLTPDALRRKSRLQPNKLLVVYHCSYCEAAFGDFPSIKDHESKHTANGDAVFVNMNPQTNYFGTKLIPGGDSKYNCFCPVCMKGFDLSSKLGKHFRLAHKKELRDDKLRKRKQRQKSLNSNSHQPNSTNTNSEHSQLVPPLNASVTENGQHDFSMEMED